MIPCLYSSDERLFDHNGIGKLSSAEDATVVEGLNSKYDLEIKYPIFGIHFSEIKQNAIIMAQPGPDLDPQPFRVYRITKPLSGRVMIYAKHLAYDLSGITTDPFSLSGPAAAFQAMKDNASVDCPFDFATDIESDAIISVSTPKDIWSLMGNGRGAMLDVFGGEYLFDRFTVSLLKQRGEDRGVTIKYGKNLTSFEQDENVSECFTAVHPFWKDSEGTLVQLPERIVQCEGNFEHIKILPLDISQEFKQQPTKAQIRDFTTRYIADNDIGKPKTSWKISYVDRGQTVEYRDWYTFDKVYMGDTVTIDYENIGIDVKSRVTETRYKPLLERYESVTLGDVKATMASTIVSNKYYADTAAQNAVSNQSAYQAFYILSNGGKVQGIFRGDDGQLYLNLTYAKAGTLDCGTVNVINLNADSLNAGKVRALNGMSYFDLDTGKFISVGPNQDAVCIQNGELWLENSAGKMRVWIKQDRDHTYIYCLDDDGNVKGGMGTYGNHFNFMAPEETIDGQGAGHPVIWKTINGEKVLCAVTEVS